MYLPAPGTSLLICSSTVDTKKILRDQQPILAISTMCEVTPSLLPYETAFASEFASTTAIDLAHRASPRYGNPTDVTLLVIGNEEDQKAYLIGVFSGAITIFIFAMIWVLLLIYFKVRGPKRYGWLSGSRDPLPPNPLLADPRNHDLRLVAIDASRMLNESRQENSQVMTTIASVSSREHSDAPTTCEIEERLPPTKDRHEQGDQDIFAGWVASYLAQHIQNERMRVIVFLSTLGIVIADILMLLNG